MTTNDDMMFDPGMVDEIDQDTVEKNEIQFPIVQWHRGDPKFRKAGGMDYQGGFFVSENVAPADLTAYGWEHTSWVHGDTDETEGYYIRELSLSLIRERKRWEVYEENRRSNYAWRDYDKAREAGLRATGRSHVLVLIKGLEEFGPFVLTLRGMAGVYFSGSRHIKGVLTQFDSVIMKAANDAVRKAGKHGVMPRRAFWLNVGAARDAKGAPVFIEVGSGNDKSHMVIPMALGLPDKAEQVDLQQFFVGRELLAKTNDLYTENETWAKAWDEIVPGSSDQNQAEAEPVAANNVAAVTESVAEELGL